MHASNEIYFRTDRYTETFLRTRGFDRRGNRSGGIKDPNQVLLAPDMVLLRFFHDEDSRFGGWWSTPGEVQLIVDYFGRAGMDGAHYDPGRAQGKGMMHATLAVRHEWSIRRKGARARTDHLSRFGLAKVRKPIYAMYGEGDSAPSADQSSNLKPVQIQGRHGEWRSSAQLFIPNLFEYRDSLMHIRDGNADTDLVDALRTVSTAPLYFEI